MIEQASKGGAAKREAKPRSARDCALSMLERCDRTARELRRKLKEKGCLPEEIEETLVFLEEYGYVNDGEYAKRYIRSHSSRKSIRRIRMELEQKGVDPDLIEAGFACVPVDEEAQIAAWVRKKGYDPDGEAGEKQYRKIAAGLYRKGYSSDAIRKVMG